MKFKEQRISHPEPLNSKLAFEDEGTEKRSDELVIAYKELAYENEEKEKRAAELVIINRKLAAQNREKEKLATELIIANRELAYQNQEKEKRATELEIINKELHSFAYVSSHDLQEPLRKIRNFADRLLAKEIENLSESGKIYLKKIQSSSALMQQLIEDLLAFSRINTADRKFKCIDLNSIMDEIKIQFSEMIEEKQASIHSEGLGMAFVIQFQFRQLMHNLVGNALKFARPGTRPVLVIRSRIKTGEELETDNPSLKGKIDSKMRYCHIAFEDNGIGFESRFKEYIFEMFKKLRPKEEYAGTGIGLAIVRKIVESHNGIILAQAKLNIGTTFDIYIPDSPFR